MPRFEVYIPAVDEQSFNVTFRVDAGNWMAALKTGMQKLGEQGSRSNNVLVDVQEDNSVHVTEPESGRVFRIRELSEEEAAAAQVKAGKFAQEGKPQQFPAANAKTEEMAPVGLEKKTEATPAATTGSANEAAAAGGLGAVAKPQVESGSDTEATVPFGKLSAGSRPDDQTLPGGVPAAGPDDATLPFRSETDAKLTAKPTNETAPEVPSPRLSDATRSAGPSARVSDAPSPAGPVPLVKRSGGPKEREEPLRRTLTGETRVPTNLPQSVVELERPTKPIVGPIGRPKATKSEREALEDVLAEVFERVDYVNREKDPQQALYFLLDLALEKIPAESGSVLRADTVTGDLTFEAARGPKADELLKAKIVIPHGVGIAGFCSLEGVCVALSDVQRDERFYPKVSERLQYQTKSVLTAPMMTHGRAFGCFQVLNKKDGTMFSAYEMGLLSYLAHQGALFLNAKG